MNGKEKWAGITMMGLLGIIQLCGAVLYGKDSNWFMFGLSLGGSIIMTIFFVTALLIFKIDSSFKRLEKKLDGKENDKKQ